MVHNPLHPHGCMPGSLPLHQCPISLPTNAHRINIRRQVQQYQSKQSLINSFFSPALWRLPSIDFSKSISIFYFAGNKTFLKNKIAFVLITKDEGLKLPRYHFNCHKKCDLSLSSPQNSSAEIRFHITAENRWCLLTNLAFGTQLAEDNHWNHTLSRTNRQLSVICDVPTTLFCSSLLLFVCEYITTGIF